MPNSGSQSCNTITVDAGAVGYDLAPVVAAAGDADLPTEILLIPAGRIETRPHDRRAGWINDAPAEVIANTLALKADLIIDYEHSSLHLRDKGEPIPAAGWIKTVFERAGAIWGRVEWTPRGAEFLRNREIRFISPMFEAAKATGRVLRLRGAALTNDPALYMTAIASAQTGDQNMDMTAILNQLGLKADASADDVLAKLKAQSVALEAASALSDTMTKVAKALGLDATAKASDIERAAASLVTASADAGTPDPTKYAPMELVTGLQAELQSIKNANMETAAAQAVDGAIKAGKLPPAQKDWAMQYASADLDGFGKFVDGAPQIVGGRIIEKASADDGEISLSDAELVICRVTGTSPEKFRASKKDLSQRSA